MILRVAIGGSGSIGRAIAGTAAELASMIGIASCVAIRAGRKLIVAATS